MQGLGLPFIQGVKVNLDRSFIVLTKPMKQNGVMSTVSMAYLPWASAVALAGRPSQKIKKFGGKPWLEALGGVLVAIEQEMGGGKEQITWLPVLNTGNNPIPSEKVTSKDVSDTINRCRAKSCAMNNGVGMAIYAGYANLEANVIEVMKYLQDLAVKPDSDLLAVQPLTQNKPGKNQSIYVDWTDAVTAAKITDPDFHWEVDWYDGINPATGESQSLPFIVMGDYYMVSVTITYKGQTHSELLPIMGFAEVATANGVKMLDHQPLVKPTVHDWNRSVMRCLTKAIAVVSGYGLSVYAKADVETLVNVEMVGKKSAPPPVVEQTPTPATPPTPIPKPPPQKTAASMVAEESQKPTAVQKMQADVLERLTATGRSFQALCAFLKNTTAQSVADLTPAELLRAQKAMPLKKTEV